MLKANDGKTYIVKFQDNPQHRRILINEIVSSVCLQYLGIMTPSVAFVTTTPEFRAANPLRLQCGGARVGPEDGPHFGSCCPDDAGTRAVYDLLPDCLLPRILNSRDFLGVLAFDKWLGNIDHRQCIFYRTNGQWTASMIDNAAVLSGKYWELPEQPFGGIYPRQSVYACVRSMSDFQPWLERIACFPESVLEGIRAIVPSAWLRGDGDRLKAVLEQVALRRSAVESLIWNLRTAIRNLFPNWSTVQVAAGFPRSSRRQQTLHLRKLAPYVRTTLAAVKVSMTARVIAHREWAY